MRQRCHYDHLQTPLQSAPSRLRARWDLIPRCTRPTCTCMYVREKKYSLGARVHIHIYILNILYSLFIMGDFVCTEFIRDTVTERGTVEIQCGGRMNAAPPSVGGCVTGCSLLQLGAPQGMPLACDPRLGAIGMLDLCELDIAGRRQLAAPTGVRSGPN